ncbi:MAG: hypothetical protein K2K77_03625 [Duncaniella sp.]|nr:hypothetical protein [Duncaniella sp.]
MNKILRIPLCVITLGCAATMVADSKVVATINGNPETRELVRITFDGDNAILNFADNTTETALMSLVNITLSHEDKTAIDEIIADPDKPRGVYNLRGQRIADTK